MRGLPKSLPLNPDNTTYSFGLNPDDIAEEGIWYSLNQNLEICFQTHLIGGSDGIIQFTEHGDWLENLLIGVIHTVIKESPQDRDFIRQQWIEHLITAATHCGAKATRKSVMVSI